MARGILSLQLTAIIVQTKTKSTGILKKKHFVFLRVAFRFNDSYYTVLLLKRISTLLLLIYK